MIKHFLHILLLLPFVVNAQQKEVLHQEYFKDGSVQHEWYTLNHLPIKYWKTYFKDSILYYQRNYNTPNKISSEGWYKDNAKNGYTIEYFNDSCITKGHYKNNLKEKTWEYFTNQHLDSLGDYHLNKPVNTWQYFIDDLLVLEKTYLENSLDYTVRHYHKNGSLHTQGFVVNQQKEGYWKYYSDQQILLSCGAFKNNLKEGYWHFYSDKGILVEEGNFINNKKSKWWSFFNKSGTLSHKCELKENELNGYCVYYSNNKIIKGRYFEHGTKVKEWDNWSSFKKDYKKLND